MTRDQQRVNVGIIGGGLMGKEAAVAFARWATLIDHPVRPELTHVCDIDPVALAWFDRIPSVVARSADYHDLLGPDGPDVLYAAVRHDLHERIYVDAIEAGKSVLAEKPFGIDLAAARAILGAVERHPESFVRCSSELPFFPGAQAAISRVVSGSLGRIIETHSGFSHSSDFDRRKPINWKRQARYCGANGVLNDLGMHVLHVPLRLGWMPERVFAVLQDLVPSRPGPNGDLVPCDTIENATLLCTAIDRMGGDGEDVFPLHLTTKRIDPGQKNSWLLRVLGMNGGVEFCTRYPKTLRVMSVTDGEQVWQDVEMGSQSCFPTATGGIFEFGFSDAILQMWASYLAERAGQLGNAFGCVTPMEAVDTHRVFAAAVGSWESREVVRLG
jgi:predicted dehydrogenase